MKFTKISSVVVTAALALSAAACGSDDKKDSGTGADGKTTITYWSWLNGADALVDGFNKSQDKIVVKYEKIPSGVAGGYDKMNNAIKAGQVPEVVNVEYNALPDFASQGNLTDLTGEFGSTVATLPQGIQSMVNLGGKTWGLPRDAAPQMLYYRKDLFKKYGIEVPKTWAEFKTAAEKVKKADSSVRLTSFVNDDPTHTAGFAWQAGAKWYASDGGAWKVDYTDENSKKVMSYWDGLIKGDLIRSQPGFSPEWTKSLVDSKTISVLGASWSAGGLKTTVPDQSGKWAMAPIPTWDGKPSSGMVGGSSYVRLKGAENQEAADTFIKWATGAEGWKAQLASGTSSALPVDPKMVDVAKAAFDTKFFDGQDLYALSAAQVDSILPGWAWGPTQSVANAKQKDAQATSLTAGLQAGQDAATESIKTRGLTLAP